MIWLAWRQFRIAAVSVFLGVAAIGVTALIVGRELAVSTSSGEIEILYNGGALAMYGLPVIVGVFWGVPLITRELETGTHSLVWNQTITRDRWLATKLGLGTLAAMGATGLLSLAVTWWAAPIDAMVDGDATFESRVTPMVFIARGVAPVAYAAFAFVLGVTLGILLRRTVTAMAVTIVVFAAVQVAIPFAVRQYLVPPTESTVAITADSIVGVRVEDNGEVPESVRVAYPADAWLLANETVDQQGNPVIPLPAATRECLPPPPDESAALPDLDPVHACFARLLSDDGYRQHLSYQPASNFWPLQWAETGLFLALTALLSWFCFRRLRRLS